jgi:hypothetical protein
MPIQQSPIIKLIWDSDVSPRRPGNSLTKDQSNFRRQLEERSQDGLSELTYRYDAHFVLGHIENSATATQDKILFAIAFLAEINPATHPYPKILN